MTKKYFYDCSIQAIYMHINFGVKFGTEVKLIADLTTDPNDYKNMTPEITKIYVLAESEHIFQPREGDIGIERNLHSIETCNFGGKYWAYENQELRLNPHQHRVKTIYRDGKHFFNPKEEN